MKRKVVKLFFCEKLVRESDVLERNRKVLEDPFPYIFSQNFLQGKNLERSMDVLEFPFCRKDKFTNISLSYFFSKIIVKCLTLF